MLDPSRAHGFGCFPGVEEGKVLVAHLHDIGEPHEVLHAGAHDLLRHRAGAGIGVVAEREVARLARRAPRSEDGVDPRAEPAHQGSGVPRGGACCARGRESLPQVCLVPEQIRTALVVEVVAHRAVVLARAHREEARARAPQERRGRQAVVGDGAIEQAGEPIVAGATEEHRLAAESAHAEGDVRGRAARHRAIGLRVLARHEVDDPLAEDRDHRGIHGAEPTEAGPAVRRSRPCRATAA